MSNKKFSRFSIVSVGIVYLVSIVSILGINALNLIFASPAAPESPPDVDLNLPNYKGRNIASCAFYPDTVVDTSTGEVGQKLDCSERISNMIANGYCSWKGFSSAKYWTVYDGDSSTRRKSWIINFDQEPGMALITGRVSQGESEPYLADSYFNRIDCNN